MSFLTFLYICGIINAVLKGKYVMKNYTYSQKRESEKINKIVNDDISNQGHTKGIEDRVKKYSANICAKYGLPSRMRDNIASLIFADYENARLLPGKIENLLNILSKYGYGVEVLENNFPLLKHSTVDLLNALSIANQYGFDEEILTHYSFYSNSSAKEVYSLTEELNRIGVTPDYKSVNKLYISFNNAGKMIKLNELHPMNQRKMFLYRALYSQKLKDLDKSQAMKK